MSVGVLTVALAGAKDRLKDLAPAFKSFQQGVSADFFRGRRRGRSGRSWPCCPRSGPSWRPCRQPSAALWPPSPAWPAESSRAAPWHRSSTPLGASITIASDAVKPLADAFVRLGTFGAQYLPRLAQAFVDLSDRFDAFVTRAAGDGTLTTWVDNGLGALRLLGSVVQSVGGILRGLFTAADASGGDGLVSFAGNCRRSPTSSTAPPCRAR